MKGKARCRWSTASVLGLLACAFAVVRVFVVDSQLLSHALVDPLSYESRMIEGEFRQIASIALADKKEKAVEQPTQVCLEPLKEIYEMHDCLMQSGRSLPVDCEVAAPVHQSSFMWGQGFGRIVQHGVKTCLLASLLHRPCVVDLIRDQHYNLRSYITAGSYNWDAAARVIHAKHGTNISTVLHLMPKGYDKGHGWEELAKDNQLEQVLGYDHVLPMVWGTEPVRPASVQAHIQLWDGNNQENRDKVLLSPNFGDAWYAYGKEYVNVRGEWNRRHTGCTADRMMTLLQNAMFVPTSFSHELYRERRALVLQDTTSFQQSFNNDLPAYGAIHLRMHILNRDVYKMGVTQERVVQGLNDCFATLADRADLQWWLISDDVHVAHFVSENIPNVHSYASSMHGKTTDLKQAVKGDHSGSAINQRFGQEALAPSIIDWMTLHESQISLITHDSAYGDTGARGNGKIRGTATCGGTVQRNESRHSFPLFYIYERPRAKKAG